MEIVTSQLANGVVVGTTIALTALGLTLIFGIMHIVNRRLTGSLAGTDR